MAIATRQIRQGQPPDLSFADLRLAVLRGVRIAVAGRLARGGEPAAIRREVLVLLDDALAEGGLAAAESRRLGIAARRAVDACLTHRA